MLACGMVLIIGGCQQTEVKETGGTPTQEVPPVPYSKGPTSPPYVKGPSGPPPGVTATSIETSGSQAVTETETVRYVLPENNDVKVKQ